MNLGLVSILIVLLGLALFFWYFERKALSSKEVTVVAVLSSFAVVGRLAFAAVPSVQFTTFVVLISGYVFGSTSGFSVGCIAALVSNFFLGQGPWTPWQMLAWGLCGGTAGIAARCRCRSPRVVLVLLGLVWGYLFGWIMNVWMWLTFVHPLNLSTWLAVNAASFPHDTGHAVSNIIFAVLFGGDFARILTRFKKRFQATFNYKKEGSTNPDSLQTNNI